MDRSGDSAKKPFGGSGMGKSRVPFKTNVNRLGSKPDADTLGKPAQSGKTNEGYWLRRQDRPIKAYLVNKEKEKKKLTKWILLWVVGIPLGVLALVWLFILIFDLFTT
jgi:hypothetical protein